MKLVEKVRVGETRSILDGIERGKFYSYISKKNKKNEPGLRA